MGLNEAKAKGQRRALEIGGVVSIRRIKPRQFEIQDGVTPFDKRLAIIVHPSWVTDGRYERLGWPSPEAEGAEANEAKSGAV